MRFTWAHFTPRCTRLPALLASPSALRDKGVCHHSSLPQIHWGIQHIPEGKRSLAPSREGRENPGGYPAIWEGLGLDPSFFCLLCSPRAGSQPPPFGLPPARSSPGRGCVVVAVRFVLESQQMRSTVHKGKGVQSQVQFKAPLVPSSS